MLCLKIEKYASLESFNFSLLVLNIVCHGKLCEFEAICITYLFSLKFLGTNILALSLFSDSKRLLCLTLDLPKGNLLLNACHGLYNRYGYLHTISSENLCGYLLVHKKNFKTLLLWKCTTA